MGTGTRETRVEKKNDRPNKSALQPIKNGQRELAARANTPNSPVSHSDRTDGYHARMSPAHAAPRAVQDP